MKAMDYNALIKEWILYLKSNKIASAQSDPKSGRLKYLRKVSVEDLTNFLDYKTDFNKKAIEKAIQSVLKNRPTSNLPATQQAQQNQKPGSNVPAPSTQPPVSQQQPKKKKFDTSNATDVEPRFGPRRSLPAPSTLEEDIVDDQGPEIHEKEIEDIFKILTTAAPKTDDVNAKKQKLAKVRNTELKKLQDVITNTMSPEQRKQLWDELQGTPVAEDYVERDEAETILKYVANNSYLRNKIDINDLRSAWAKAGYPEDTDEIKQILKKFGFDEPTIDNAISQVVGNDDPDNADNTDSGVSEVIIKIAQYIKKAGLTNDIIKFMQQNFANDIKDVEPKQNIFKRAVNYGKNLFKRKATTEDVKNIFAKILEEERKDLTYLIQIDELSRLGRNKK